MVAELGGTRSFTADVVITEQSGPSLSGVLNEGDFIEFGYLMDEIDWDYTSNLRITDILVVVDWDASGGAGPGRQVTFDVSSDNNTVGESQNDGGGGGEIIIEWAINPLPETVSDLQAVLMISYRPLKRTVNGWAVNLHLHKPVKVLLY